MIRQGSIDDINAHQYLKISNYEDTVRQLDIYYAIGLYIVLKMLFESHNLNIQ